MVVDQCEIVLMTVARSEAATVTGLARCSLAPLLEQPLDTDQWTSIISNKQFLGNFDHMLMKVSGFQYT